MNDRYPPILRLNGPRLFIGGDQHGEACPTEDKATVLVRRSFRPEETERYTRIVARTAFLSIIPLYVENEFFNEIQSLPSDEGARLVHDSLGTTPYAAFFDCD